MEFFIIILVLFFVFSFFYNNKKQPNISSRVEDNFKLNLFNLLSNKGFNDDIKELIEENKTKIMDIFDTNYDKDINSGVFVFSFIMSILKILHIAFYSNIDILLYQKVSLNIILNNENVMRELYKKFILLEYKADIDYENFKEVIILYFNFILEQSNMR